MMSIGTRTLKVAETGDFYKSGTKPRINLEGKWLINAGISSEDIVEIENPKEGVLVITAKKVKEITQQ